MSRYEYRFLCIRSQRLELARILPSVHSISGPTYGPPSPFLPAPCADLGPIFDGFVATALLSV